MLCFVLERRRLIMVKYHSKQSIYGHYGLSVRTANILPVYSTHPFHCNPPRKTSAIIYGFIAFDGSPIIKLLLNSNHMVCFYCMYFVSLPSIIYGDYYSSVVSTQAFCPDTRVRIPKTARARKKYSLDPNNWIFSGHIFNPGPNSI